jgi:dienelactone hydrolase
MMSYNPFDRGPLPVGVRTISFAKRQDESALTTAELWYPAAPAYKGRDTADSGGDRFPIAAGIEGRQAAVRDAQPADITGLPLLIYCHGGYGHRRDNAALACHLASHGYVVVAPQFLDSMADMGLTGGEATIKHESIDRSAAMRPRQASWVISEIITGADPTTASLIDPSRIGVFGGSLGGYTALELNAVDDRLGAIVALAPACGYRSPLPVMRRIDALMHRDRWRSIPTTLIAGNEDLLVELDDVRELFDAIGAPKRLVVLHEAGHLHMFDNAAAGHELFRKEYTSGQFPDPEIDALAIGRAMRPFAEMLSEAGSAAAIRAITLAHMDACVKGGADAAAFLDADLAGVFQLRGTVIDVLAGVHA